MKKHITAFYLETLLLIAVLVAVILVLTGVFSGAKAQSARAGRLTQAVVLAENAAEAVAASDSLEAVQGLLDENGNTRVEDRVLTVFHDAFQVHITWEPNGALASSTITVFWNDSEIYALETAVCTEAEG